MGYDLHTHSKCSDGSLTPAELIRQAVSQGLDGIALTDHDTVDGIKEALSEAEQLDFTLIPGVEFTTDYGVNEAHILGYRFDYENPVLLQKFETILEARNRRALEMIGRLNKNRIPLTWEQVKEQASGRFIGRPHIFKAMERAGFVNHEHRDAVFDYYLGTQGVAYVPHQEIDTIEAIKLLVAAGGIPVLAHPARIGTEKFIEELVGYGLQGLEVYYPSHTPEMIAHYLNMAQRYHLYVTGGSDYHGNFGRSALGEAQAPILPWTKVVSNQDSVF